MTRVHGRYPNALLMRLHDFLPLHWCVTPRASIARANFLDGTDAHWFKNLEAFDIVELRALAAVIPQPKELRNVEDEEGEPFTYRREYSYSMLSEPLSAFPHHRRGRGIRVSG